MDNIVCGMVIAETGQLVIISWKHLDGSSFISSANASSD
jgi:hypothetical protein